MKYHRPNCGFFIFEPFDSWKRQPTAGGDSKTFMDSFVSSNIKTGWVSFNSISAQTYFVRRMRESAFPAGPTPQGFSNQHSPLTMYRRTEVFQFIRLPRKGICCLFYFSFWGFGFFYLQRIFSSVHVSWQYKSCVCLPRQGDDARNIHFAQPQLEQ
jgi:hypothetical protein